MGLLKNVYFIGEGGRKNTKNHKIKKKKKKAVFMKENMLTSLHTCSDLVQELDAYTKAIKKVIYRLKRQ